MTEDGNEKDSRDFIKFVAIETDQRAKQKLENKFKL